MLEASKSSLLLMGGSSSTGWQTPGTRFAASVNTARCEGKECDFPAASIKQLALLILGLRPGERPDNLHSGAQSSTPARAYAAR